MTNNHKFVSFLILIGCLFSFIPNSQTEIPALIIGGALTHLQKGNDYDGNDTEIK